MSRSNNLPTAGILDAVLEPRLIGDTLSAAQAVALKTLYGLPLDLLTEQAIHHQATEKEVYEPREYREACFICGRRSGKSSKLAANIAVFEAVFRQHNLARGERGHVVVLATTTKQAQVVFDYILARLEGSPTLRRLIEDGPRADEVDLTNGITIAVWPCNFRSIRGLSIVCCIADECAFWKDDSGANPASEVFRAIRPAMSTFPRAKLVKISSPFAKSGCIWTDFQARHKRDDLLVWRLDSATMNPSLDRDFLAAEQARDPEFFAREYMAEFWESATGFLPPEMIDAAIVPGRSELAHNPEFLYSAALDAAFRGDNFAFSLVHRTDAGRIVQDVLRCWRGSRAKPVNMTATVEEIVVILRRFGVTRIAGDQHCAEPIRQALAAQHIDFVQRTTLGNKAQVMNTLRTLVTSGQIELLDDSAQTAELKALEQIVTGSGSVRVEASGSGHDDRAVALAQAAHEATTNIPIRPWVDFIWTDGRDVERGWQRI